MKTVAAEKNTSPFERSVDLIIQKFMKFNMEVIKFFTQYEERYYYVEVAPGKNRASYLLGHLAVANDELFPFLGLGDMRYPHLLRLYFSPDRAYPDSDLQTIKELLDAFGNINDQLERAFREMPMESWLDKHTRVSDADFAKDPARCKLGVLLNRVAHLDHHLGQLQLMPLSPEIEFIEKLKSIWF